MKVKVLAVLTGFILAVGGCAKPRGVSHATLVKKFRQLRKSSVKTSKKGQGSCINIGIAKTDAVIVVLAKNCGKKGRTWLFIRPLGNVFVAAIHVKFILRQFFGYIPILIPKGMKTLTIMGKPTKMYTYVLTLKKTGKPQKTPLKSIMAF